jgi:magnesium-protoporphyrin O-methyltransferase
MMPLASYDTRRTEVEAYFDRTAVDAWARLTSNEPVGRIRQTVRDGRNQMRSTLLEWLPLDLVDKRVLDAGCGPGQLSVEAAQRGGNVVGIDLSATLIGLAQQRLATEIGSTKLEFRVGDMLDPALGHFDHVVSMDALIHYGIEDCIAVLGQWAARTHRSIIFTFAPRTPALALMHATGRIFPSSNRAPAIVPVAEASLREGIAKAAALTSWRIGRTQRIAAGFYTSQAMELVRR